MKRITQIVTAAAIAVVPLFAGSSAYATWACEIGYTGPDSDNMCKLESTYTCTIKNENEFEIINNNTQEATSGTATNSGNTEGGSATSGSATNQNGTTINVDIDNSGSEGLCSVVSTIPATEKPTPTKPTAPKPKPTPRPVVPGGMGSVSRPVVKETVQAPQKAAPSVLPYTSSNGLVNAVVAATGLLAVGAIVTRLAVASYSRSKS